MEFFERHRPNLNDELETLRLPKRLENYKVRYQEIVPCGWCGNLHDIHSMARGEDVFTRNSWFCSPYCEAAYLTDESEGEEFFNETEGMLPEEIPWDSAFIDAAKDRSEADGL